MLRSPRLALLALLLLAAAILSWRRFSPVSHSTTLAATASGPSVAANRTAGSANSVELTRPEPAGGPTRARLSYAQAWEGELPPAMAAFRAWTTRHLAARPDARGLLEAEGVALARARRAEMLDLIKTDPRRALAVTVPAVVRAQLPAAVLAELETRVAGRGDFALIASTPREDEPTTRPMRRVATIGGMAYTAHPYGRRDEQFAKNSASLHGVALGRELALHESPVRVLEPGEALPGASDGVCPVSALPADPANADAVVAFGRTWSFCGRTDDMVEQFERNLVRVEETGEATGSAPSPTPRVAAEATNSRTIGTQRVLVIRVDFSDFPGAYAAASDVQAIMDGNVKPYFEDASFGQASVTSTVSANVYRLPQSGNYYAVNDQDTQMHTDARNLAAVDYPLANYDRVLVLFPNLGSSRVSGSTITYAGAGQIGGPYVWLNGTTAWQTICHELGHTWGLYHANLWRVTDGNPISAAGRSLEYGDPFDIMGSTSVTGVTRDTRHQYNHRFKNRLGWMPDSTTRIVNTSGTYRVYRFDHKDALTFNQPLALCVLRDGKRSYWIGYRQNFSSGTLTANGAYVLWGFNNNQQSLMLDLTTPGISANDAVIPVGSTFTDPTYGISIKPVARGGTDPALYLDVEITVPATRPNFVSAWGRDTVLFYNEDTGLLNSPLSEVYVPDGLTDAVAIAAGDAHTLALKPDGTVVAWGDNTNGQTNIPSGLTNVGSIAAGGNVSGAVKRDGTIVMWGEAVGGVTTPPPGLTGVKQLVIGGAHSVGIYHALALKTDGTIVGWGDNTRGQITTPTTAASGVISIAASDRLSVALKSDGTVVRWGTTFSGALPFPTGLSGVTAIATSGGAGHVLALKTDGTVVGWGVNNNDRATAPAGLSGVVAIATGTAHSLALKSDGTIVAWGLNDNGRATPPYVLPRAYAIAGGGRASYALTGGASNLIAFQPQSQSVAAGGSVTLSVSAIGYAPISYQWRKNGTAIAGATASTLTLSNVSAADAATYDVLLVFSGGAAPVTSSAAALTIGTGGGGPSANPARLINLSILTPLASNETMTMGTVLGGAGTSGGKPLLVRAVGPSLSQLGVNGVLPDPRMTINSTATSPAVVVGTNDDWGGTTALSTAFSAVGAFPYAATSSKDAAVFNTFPAGPYTVQVTGGTGSGTVIAELYDSTPTGTFTATTPRLVNVSVLKQLGSGQTLTAGFVVGGSGQKQILIRAVGPGLSQLGVGGVMADPKLTLFQAGVSASLNSNDDWGGGAALSAAFAAVGAFALNPQSKDAAIVLPLSPGNYTAQVTGVNGSFGLALVEVYEVP